MVWNILNKETFNWQLLFVFIIIPIFYYSQLMLYRITPYLEGVALGDIELFAESYGKQNIFVNNGNAHAAFFQTPMLVNFISTVLGVSSAVGSLIVTFVYLIFTSLFGLYFLRMLGKSNNKLLSVVIVGIAFLATSDLIGIFTYRDIAGIIFVFLLCFIYKTGLKTKNDLLVTLFLVIGITVGSPIAALLLGSLFVVFTILSRRVSLITFAVIPLFYLATFSAVYLYSLRFYANQAIGGFSDFLGYLTGGESITRILPWGRISSLSIFDTYMASITTLSLLFLFFLILLIYTYLIAKKSFKESNKSNQGLLLSSYLVGGSAFLIFIIIYIGASVISESSFSDIRTIFLLFLYMLLPVFFFSRSMLKIITSKKILIIIFIIFLLISSLKTVSSIYPKSANDPINIVEDRRLDYRSQYFVGIFLRDYLSSGSIVLDYKTSRPITSYYLASENYQITYPSISSMEDTIIVFNINGLVYESPFTSFETYAYLYNLSLSRNLVYSSGDILILKNDL